jgi:hypothetical protein
MEIGKRRASPREKALNRLETTNMVNEEAPPFCRDCEDFHEDSTCPIFCQINEQGFPETTNYVGYSIHFDFINNVGIIHYVTNDQWKKTKYLSKKGDNVTKLYGEKPTP